MGSSERVAGVVRSMQRSYAGWSLFFPSRMPRSEAHCVRCVPHAFKADTEMSCRARCPAAPQLFCPAHDLRAGNSTHCARWAEACAPTVTLGGGNVLHPPNGRL